MNTAADYEEARRDSGSGAQVSEETPVNYFEFRDVCKSFDERLVLDHVRLRGEARRTA